MSSSTVGGSARASSGSTTGVVEPRPGPGAPVEAPGPDAAAAAILEDVPLVMRAIRARMREGRPAGMSVAQFRALLQIRRNPGSGLSEIAEHLGTSVPAASELVSRLVREDLVRRETDPHERRRIRLTLSPAGSGQLDLAQRAAMTWLRSLVSGLSPERQHAIVQALADLRSLVEPAELTEPAEPAGPVESAGPAEPAGPVESAGPAEPAGPVESAGPADHADPSPAGPIDRVVATIGRR